MKIKNRATGEVLFSTLMCGVVFTTDRLGGVYMKIPAAKIDDSKKDAVNAVELECGLYRWFHPSDSVLVHKNATLVLDGAIGQ